ncbi:MAG: hypothetical protein ABR906_04145 [Terracidiphilus sp.]|jgi:hypothetical protein
MNESAAPAAFASAHSLPMSFGQLFDRSFRLMHSHLRLFLGIAAVPCGAIFLLLMPVIGFMLLSIAPHIADQTAPRQVMPILVLSILMGISYLLFPLIYALYLPAASYAATQADLGVAVTFREAYSVAWRRFGRHLWLMILGSLLMIVPVLACVLIVGSGAILLRYVMGETALVLIPLAVLLYIAALVYSILIMLRFSLAYPVCVVEGRPAWASLKRSAELTEGAKGRIFLVLLVVYALTYLVSLACIAVFGVVGALVAILAILAHVTAGSPAFIVLIALAVLGYFLILVVTGLCSYAAFTTALAVIYHDQRLRKDGPPTAPIQAGEAA